MILYSPDLTPCDCDPVKVMVADRPYGEFYDLNSFSPEYFGYTLVTFRFHITREIWLAEEILDIQGLYSMELI
jgi:hypothetical protein